MLFITRRERIAYITMSGLDRVQFGALSWTPQYRIVLSWDLLGWMSVEGRIFSSFTRFITTPELSGLWYISPDIYHTQLTEYLLEKIYQRSFFFLDRDWTFREHVSRALPTEKNFYLLRSIPSDNLARDHTAKSMLGVLEIVIKWLQGLGSERPSDLYDRFRDELLLKKAHLLCWLWTWFSVSCPKRSHFTNSPLWFLKESPTGIYMTKNHCIQSLDGSFSVKLLTLKVW